MWVTVLAGLGGMCGLTMASDNSDVSFDQIFKYNDKLFLYMNRIILFYNNRRTQE